jgi:hypothetical protein
MIRVWGGGFFEPDIFYDLCDEMGVLVWQDCKSSFFPHIKAMMIELRLVMFACGVYPIFPEFLESVKKEAECNVKRLRHHPSLALFCGNNEDCESPPLLLFPWLFCSTRCAHPAPLSLPSRIYAGHMTDLQTNKSFNGILTILPKTPSPLESFTNVSSPISYTT